MVTGERQILSDRGGLRSLAALCARRVLSEAGTIISTLAGFPRNRTTLLLRRAGMAATGLWRGAARDRAGAGRIEVRTRCFCGERAWRRRGVAPRVTVPAQVLS